MNQDNIQAFVKRFPRTRRSSEHVLRQVWSDILDGIPIGLIVFDTDGTAVRNGCMINALHDIVDGKMQAAHKLTTKQLTNVVDFWDWADGRTDDQIRQAVSLSRKLQNATVIWHHIEWP